MSDSDLKDRAYDEIKRLQAILADAGITERRKEVLAPIIENTAWMRAKLDDARELINDGNVAIPYDNGGGQKGIRENPAFKGYEALWKSYMSGMSKILDSLPQENIEPLVVDTKPQTVLDAIRAKHNKVS